MTAQAGPSRASLTLFAFADFGFNLYWQSVMLFLLFYYTDTLGFSIAAAAATYMIASIWDGIIGFAIGIIADRSGRANDYRRALTWGAIPLGLSFILAYLPLAAAGSWNLYLLFVAHLIFRTMYAFVNVPYLAMTARISSDSRDRAYVAGVRMISGTLAAVLVSLGTVRLGQLLLGPGGDAYLGSAIIFAVLATIILIVVGRTYRDQPGLPPPGRIPVRELLMLLARNRAFILLSIAMIAMIIAATMISKSVLYYFKYFLGNEDAGQLALAAMMATGLVAIPLWMLLARRFGVRLVWITAIAIAVVLLGLFIAFDLERAGAMQLFLVALQVAMIGLNFAVWALLPDTIDHGEEALGKRVEASVFGLASLFQRIAIGLATGLLGLGYHKAGFEPNQALTPATLTQIRGVMSVVPIIMFLLSGIAIALAPGLDRRNKPGA